MSSSKIVLFTTAGHDPGCHFQHPIAEWINNKDSKAGPAPIPPPIFALLRHDPGLQSAPIATVAPIATTATTDTTDTTATTASMLLLQCAPIATVAMIATILAQRGGRTIDANNQAFIKCLASNIVMVHSDGTTFRTRLSSLSRVGLATQFIRVASISVPHVAQDDLEASVLFLGRQVFVPLAAGPFCEQALHGSEDFFV